MMMMPFRTDDILVLYLLLLSFTKSMDDILLNRVGSVLRCLVCCESMH